MNLGSSVNGTTKSNFNGGSIVTTQQMMGLNLNQYVARVMLIVAIGVCRIT
jgi:hypothetical protein